MRFACDFDAVMLDTGKEVHSLKEYLTESLTIVGIIGG